MNSWASFCDDLVFDSPSCSEIVLSKHYDAGLFLNTT